MASSKRRQAGFQVTASGDLRIWSGGPPCKGVTKISVELEKSDEGSTTVWTIRSTRDTGASVDTLDSVLEDADSRTRAG